MSSMRPQQHSLASKTRLPGGITSRLAWFGTAAVVSGYVIAIALASPLSLQDYPNHLARAVVIADLTFHHGAVFGSAFEYHLIAAPYILGDLLLAPAVELFGPDRAGALWACLVFLSWPFAVAVYLRVARVPVEMQVLGVLLATYLSTDFFFLKGFFEFRLGLALTVISLAVADILRSRRSIGVYCLYVGIVATGYLTHLSTLVFTAAIISVSGAVRLWQRTTSVGREVSLLVPVAALLAWHFGIAVGYGRSGEQHDPIYSWASLYDKVQAFDLVVLRDKFALQLLFLACIGAVVLGRMSRRALVTPAVLEMLSLGTVFAALYLVLPFSYPAATQVDKRALPLAVLFVLFACFKLPVPKDVRRDFTGASLLCAALLAAVNLAYLERYFSEATAWSAHYRAIVAAVPQGSWVLPITTLKLSGPYLHAGTAVVIDQRGFVPTLFSANAGDAMKHFRYVRWPYMPTDEGWYGNHLPVDWHKIGCAYQFLIVTQPFDRARIEIPTHIVAANASAALLAVEPSACASNQT